MLLAASILNHKSLKIAWRYYQWHKMHKKKNFYILLNGISKSILWMHLMAFIRHATFKHSSFRTPALLFNIGMKIDTNIVIILMWVVTNSISKKNWRDHCAAGDFFFHARLLLKSVRVFSTSISLQYYRYTSGAGFLPKSCPLHVVKTSLGQWSRILKWQFKY